jgi:hypothetical protein
MPRMVVTCVREYMGHLERLVDPPGVVAILNLIMGEVEKTFLPCLFKRHICSKLVSLFI